MNPEHESGPVPRRKEQERPDGLPRIVRNDRLLLGLDERRLRSELQPHLLGDVADPATFIGTRNIPRHGRQYRVRS